MLQLWMYHTYEKWWQPCGILLRLLLGRKDEKARAWILLHEGCQGVVEVQSSCLLMKCGVLDREGNILSLPVLVLVWERLLHTAILQHMLPQICSVLAMFSISWQMWIIMIWRSDPSSRTNPKPIVSYTISAAIIATYCKVIIYFILFETLNDSVQNSVHTFTGDPTS